MSKPFDVDPETFASAVLAQPGVTVVDFWASWCAPCRAIAPALDAIASEGVVRVAKVDSEKHPNLGVQYNITGLPTLLVFKEGKLVDRIVGALPKAKIEQRLARATAPAL